jgi:hypothetical protein
MVWNKDTLRCAARTLDGVEQEHYSVYKKKPKRVPGRDI